MCKTKPDLERLKQENLVSYFQGDKIYSPWFPVYRLDENREREYLHHAALIPFDSIERCLNESGFDFAIGDGAPSVWTIHEDGKQNISYERFGNRHQIEPLVFHRFYDHKPKGSTWELSQEFSLFLNLRHDTAQKCYYLLNHDEEEEAVRYSDGLIEIRTDLILRYASAKNMALVSYISSHCFSVFSLGELGLEKGSKDFRDSGHAFSLRFCDVPYSDNHGRLSFSDCYGKKFFFPPQVEEDEAEEFYQDFIIDSDALGKEKKHTCDPSQLADNFGLNPDAPHYLTPVYFRKEVLAKYYLEPERYEVKDGGVYCSGIWNLRLDNNHDDYVVVWLGDLGRDLREKERNYWTSYNVPPHGKGISKTTYTRAIEGWFAKPTAPDLAFRAEYDSFRSDFIEQHGWGFFLEMHEDDQYCLKTLHCPLSENAAEFDDQVLNLTKLLVDSLNVKAIQKELQEVEANEGGIKKLERYFSERGWGEFEEHIQFLKDLQALRSEAVAHRKGSRYQRNSEILKAKENGYKVTFNGLLKEAICFMEFLRCHFSTPSQEWPERPQ